MSHNEDPISAALKEQIGRLGGQEPRDPNKPTYLDREPAQLERSETRLLMGELNRQNVCIIQQNRRIEDKLDKLIAWVEVARRAKGEA